MQLSEAKLCKRKEEVRRVVLKETQRQKTDKDKQMCGPLGEGRRERLTGNRAEVEVVSDDLLVVVVH